MELNHREVLRDLVLAEGCRRVAEIGVMAGLTAEVVMTACRTVREYWAVDPWRPYKDRVHGTVTAKGWEQVYRSAYVRLSRLPGVAVLRITSKEAARRAPEEHFDLVFIDGDHGAQAVAEDLELWEPKVRPGGILCGHDYAPRQYPGVVRAVKERYPDEFELIGGRVWVWRKPVPEAEETPEVAAATG